MASTEPSLPPAFTSADTWRKRVETHATFIREAASVQANLNYKTLNELNDKIVGLVTTGLRHVEKQDLANLLDIQWCDILEREEDRIWKSKGNKLEGHVCVYLTRQWVYVVAYTKTLGNTNINFGNPKADKPGFQAKIRHINGKLCWGYNYDNLTNDEQGKPLSIDSLYGDINRAANGEQRSREIVTELFQRVKEYVDIKMEETISEIFLVEELFPNFKEHTFLRECCMKAGFKRIIIIRESPATAYMILSILQHDKQAPKPDSILVIYYAYGMRLEIFGADINGSEVNGVHLLTSVTTKSDLGSTKNAYERALARLSIPKRNSLRYYVWAFNCSSTFDKYFQDELKLIKLENLSTNNNILELFSHSPNNPSKFLKSIGGLHSTTINVSPAADKLDKPLEKDANIPTGETKLLPAKAKIPLRIQGHGGRMHNVLAYSDWTVEKLKDEYIRCNGQRDAGPVVLQYTKTTTRTLTDGNLLGLYKLEPDSVIQAKSVNADMGNANKAAPKLIANCVARQNGIKETPADGIKEGNIMLARTDMENLTVGYVGASCEIIGYGDQVFVGVKFKKHLPLGSSGIQIEHIAGIDVDCDKCKGRKCLFIPLDQIGNSKDYLFEVQ